jgi:thiamine biosynthesis lipoprotein
VAAPKLRTLLLALGLLALLVVAVLLRSPHEPGVSAPPELPEGRAGAGDGWTTFETEVMATTVRVTVPEEPPGIGAEEAAEAVFRVFRRVDAEMSEWKESSPLSEVNRRAGGGPVAVPAELREVIRRGLEIGELTGGAFDVTWAALWGLWDFRAPEPVVPPAAEIERRARLVDYRRVELDEALGAVRLPEPGMTIGLGGIAKGYALAEAAEVLRERGLEDFLLVSGGQVYAAGARSEGGSGAGENRPWRVGVRDPRGGPEDFFALLELADASASTSGDYERYFVAAGVRYHHILDPRTGRPARGLRSATVVSADAVLADALSTGIFVMGPEAGLALAERLPGVEAVLVDGDGGVLTTAGLEGRLEVLYAPAK